MGKYKFKIETEKYADSKSNIRICATKDSWTNGFVTISRDELKDLCKTILTYLKETKRGEQ